MRSSAFTAPRARTDAAVPAGPGVGAGFACGRGLFARNRPSAGWLDASPRRTAVVGVLAAAFLAKRVVSTRTFLTSWQDNPTKSYLSNAVAGLASARAASASPMLDREVDPLILQRVVGPENLVSHMFALVRDRPGFSGSTDRLRMLDSSGHVVDADVTWVRRTVAGPRPQCASSSRPSRRPACPSTGRCCRRLDRGRSTIWPTSRAAS